MKSWKPLLVGTGLALVLLAGLAVEGQEKGKKRAARKEPTAAQPAQPLAPADLARLIDRHLDARLRSDQIPASPRADDAAFLRRVHLDLLGVIPTADQVTAFLADTDPDKRAMLVDALLAHPRFGEHLGDIWTRLIIPKDSNNRFLQPAVLRDWLTQQFNANRPWNEFATDLLTATGTTEGNGAVTYFLANGTVDKMTDLTARLFLGVQLQCAQCHNHPFVPEWTQDDYWGMTAFFLKVQTSNPRAARNGGELSVNENGSPRGNRRNLPEAAKILPPKFFLGAKPPTTSGSLRPMLAQWLTAPENPYFAQATVNRFWAHLFGRGLVNPIDDFQDDNAPTHPELLLELRQQFVASGFDLKHLLKAICLSEAYQRSSRPLEGNKADTTLYSRMNVKNLTPGQLFDSLDQVLGQEDASETRRRRQQQAQRGGPRSPREAFIAFFDTDDGADPLEYQAGIPQALRLMNAQSRPIGGVINRIVKPGEAPAVVIDRLYLMTLSRPPLPEERSKLVALADAHRKEVKKVYEDILWALLNSSEFAMNP